LTVFGKLFILNHITVSKQGKRSQWENAVQELTVEEEVANVVPA